MPRRWRSLGVYGLIAYTVAQRTQEIGIRLALGASRARVVGELLTQGSRLVVAGLVSGIVLAFTGRGIVTASVFGVSAGDLLMYVMAAAIFRRPRWRRWSSPHAVPPGSSRCRRCAASDDQRCRIDKPARTRILP